MRCLAASVLGTENVLERRIRECGGKLNRLPHFVRPRNLQPHVRTGVRGENIEICVLTEPHVRHGAEAISSFVSICSCDATGRDIDIF